MTGHLRSCCLRETPKNFRAEFGSRASCREMTGYPPKITTGQEIRHRRDWRDELSESSSSMQVRNAIFPYVDVCTPEKDLLYSNYCVRKKKIRPTLRNGKNP